MSARYVTLDVTVGDETGRLTSMSALAAVRVAPPTTGCPDCGVLVMTVHTADQRRVTLDAQPVPGGLYALDEHNRAQRRGLVELYRERVSGDLRVFAYDPHDCTPVPWYAR